jgi:hypothetical protein
MFFQHLTAATITANIAAADGVVVVVVGHFIATAYVAVSIGGAAQQNTTPCETVAPH